jgi:nucleotide-binding universal stress UspA family protein
MPGTVVCGVNESAGAREAALVVGALGKQLDLRVVLVHVVDGTTSSDAAEDDEDKPTREARTGGKRFLDRFSDEHGLEGAERRIETGYPAERLAEVAAEERAALIVVGARAQRRRWRPTLRSDLSRDIARVTPCPVFVVPPASTDRASRRDPLFLSVG